MIQPSPHASAPWWRSRRAALVIAHPGHELRVHHWVELASPVVLLLSDGSGSRDAPRLDKTRAVLDKSGAAASPFFGRVSDRELYDAIVQRRTSLFDRLIDEIMEVLDAFGIDYVAGDAVEGVNPGHDVFRLLLNAALRRLEQQGRRKLPNLEFAVEGAPLLPTEAEFADSVLLRLDEQALDRKLAAVSAYPDLAEDVRRILGSHGPSLLSMESLIPVTYDFDVADRFAHPAVYERYGQQQVSKGLYAESIRFADHVEPLAKSLERGS